MNPLTFKPPAAAVPAEPTTGAAPEAVEPAAAASPREFGGRKDGTEPTRFGDWEKNGRCVDF